MNNADFWSSVNAIVEANFTTEGLQKLDRYAEQFISGQLVYKRFSPIEQHGCAAGGSTHVIATLLAGAETETDSSSSGISDFKRSLQCGEKQAERIELIRINAHNKTCCTTKKQKGTCLRQVPFCFNIKISLTFCPNNTNLQTKFV